MKKIAILIGASNNKGNTRSLAQYVADKTNATIYNLNNYTISPFDYQHKNIDDDFIPLVESLLSYDHIIFASPVYWYCMSAQMKVFFDRMSDLLHVKKELGRELRGKSSSVISTGSTVNPERSFEEVFINSFDYLGVKYKGMIYCYCEHNFDLADHEKIVNQKTNELSIALN
ncbi:MAG: flavodoxin family protein [Xanthomonadales bacterium]|nr:flavodoxin family protein [Xanthomonadales bacterium]